MIPVTIPVRLDRKRVRQMIGGAHQYWSDDFEWIKGASYGFRIHEVNDGEIDVWHTVTDEMVEAGLEKMANADLNEGGHHFPAILREEDDMWTKDAIVQFAVFGELKYG